MSVETETGMHIDPYERGWLLASIGLVIVLAIVVGIAAFAVGIDVPAPEERVNPQTVQNEGAFANPGLYELAPGEYEAFILAQTWYFNPGEIRVPRGATVTFYITSVDVQHGFKLQGTNLNLMVLPGEVSKLTATFDEPGKFPFICHEYCGVGHHTMYGTVIVER
jgi:cytochrome c oxidase subunit 2